MAINESFGNLVNDLTEQVLQQVQQQVQGAISSAVTQRVNDLITSDVVNRVITTAVQQQINDFVPDMTLFENRLVEAGDRIINTIDTDSTQKVNDLIGSKINGVDLEALVAQFIASNLNSDGRHLSLIPGAIPGTAVDSTSLTISADNIIDGTVKNFASTGIDDKATSCQLTIMDAGTVFENTLYAPRVEVKGDAIIDGNLIIKGTIPKESQTYQNIIADVSSIAESTHDRILTRIQTETLDIAKLTIGQRSIIEGDTLTTAVVNSNLRRVGTLTDLQTAGETLLSETLYTTNRRVGINTMDPSLALSVWDEEVEISIGKYSQDTAQMTTRSKTFVIGSNNQKTITLTGDGTAVIPRLQIGNMLFYSSSTSPSDSAPKGTVVFNENPSLGGPLGWVSLGDARWANFGIID